MSCTAPCTPDHMKWSYQLQVVDHYQCVGMCLSYSIYYTCSVIADYFVIQLTLNGSEYYQIYTMPETNEGFKYDR